MAICSIAIVHVTVFKPSKVGDLSLKPQTIYWQRILYVLVPFTSLSHYRFGQALAHT
jgi:hypothetical protein